MAFHGSAAMSFFFAMAMATMVSASAAGAAAAGAAAAGASASAVPAMFVFGDSTADVGNNNYLNIDETQRANYPHNGIDFPAAAAAAAAATAGRSSDGFIGTDHLMDARTRVVLEDSAHNNADNNSEDDDLFTVDQTLTVDFAAGVGVPTGRFSNSYIGADYMAMALGFDMSPPAYLSLISINPNQMLTKGGVNFASGGSGILDTTGKSISMDTQISYFKKVVGAASREMGKEMASLYISKSLFLISTANNDLFAYYFTHASDRNTAMDEEFISSLVHKFEQQLKALYRLGGRKFWILGTAEIGCTPAMRRLSPTAPRCIEGLNDLSRLFNKLAQPRLVQLASRLNGMRYSYADAYFLSTLVEGDPSSFGFKETEKACCGRGYLNGEYACNSNATYCSRRRDFRYWDWNHPTDAYYELVAVKSFSGSADFVAPVNVQTLVKM